MLVAIRIEASVLLENIKLTVLVFVRLKPR
jgi:hypothetical protein